MFPFQQIGLTFDNSNHNTANISWRAASDLHSEEFEDYRIDAKMSGCDECSTYQLTQTNSFTITDLAPTTNYQVWVSVLGKGFGQSAASDSITIHTKPSPLLGKHCTHCNRILLEVTYCLLICFEA